MRTTIAILFCIFLMWPITLGLSSPPSESLRCAISISETNIHTGDVISVVLTLHNIGTTELHILQPSDYGGEIVVLALSEFDTNEVHSVPLSFKMGPEAATNTSLTYAWAAIKPGEEKRYPLLVQSYRPLLTARLFTRKSYSGTDHPLQPGHYKIFVKYAYADVQGLSSIRTDYEFPKHISIDPTNSTISPHIEKKVGSISVDPAKVWKGELTSNQIVLDIIPSAHK